MSGERALLNSVFGRAAAAVLAATVALVLAPAALATPESDAADAINRHTTPAAAPPARWDRAMVASIPSAEASARTTQAARSSSPPTPARTSWRARSCRSTSRSVGPATVIWAFRPSTRARAEPRTAATPRSARPTSPSSSGRPTPAPTWCAVRSTRRGTSSAARRGRWACPPRTRSSRATSSRRSSPAASSPGTGQPRSSPPFRPIWRGSSPG